MKHMKHVVDESHFLKLFEFGFKRLLICTIQFGSQQSKANGFIVAEKAFRTKCPG